MIVRTRDERKCIFEREDDGSCAFTSLQRHVHQETINKEQLAMCNAAATHARTPTHTRTRKLSCVMSHDRQGAELLDKWPQTCSVLSLWRGILACMWKRVEAHMTARCSVCYCVCKKKKNLFYFRGHRSIIEPDLWPLHTTAVFQLTAATNRNTR